MKFLSVVIFCLASAALTDSWLFKGRPRDETGHRTGLGTLGKSLIRSPVNTLKTGAAFARNYIDMVKKNTIGYDKIAHQKANYEGTKIGGNKLAGAYSALREWSKVIRGDKRSPSEIESDMRANRLGREQALRG